MTGLLCDSSIVSSETEMLAMIPISHVGPSSQNLSGTKTDLVRHDSEIVHYESENAVLLHWLERMHILSRLLLSSASVFSIC
jgi:hypothetical protein